MTMTNDSYDRWIGRDAYASDDEKLGEIKAVYYDDVTGRPEWITVKTGLLGTGATFVPIAGSEVRRHEDSDDYDLRVPYTKDQVKGAPDIDLDDGDDDDDRHLSADQERTLYSHYGFRHGERDATATYGKDYGKLRPDLDYKHARYDAKNRKWTDERRSDEHDVTVPVDTTVEVPVKANVRLRRYQTETQRTETRQVQVPVTETEEHVEVQDVTAQPGSVQRNA